MFPLHNKLLKNKKNPVDRYLSGLLQTQALAGVFLGSACQ